MKKMSRKREWIVMALCFLSEISMLFQIYKPNYFFNLSLVITGTNYWIAARAILLINMAGLALFALSVWRGNVKGRLHQSYFIMLLYSVIMFLAAVVPKQFRNTINNDSLELNALVYLLTTIMTVIVFALFILREKGAIRHISKMSTLMLFVIIGQIVTNGLFVNGSVIISHPIYFVLGIMSAMPYISVFVFEYFILEPTMKYYR